jgi:hypothetical protein
MHLRAAHQFLNDTDIPQNLRNDLARGPHLGAFLLGNVAPDARVSGGMSRGQTHFFEYAAKIEPNAGDAMLAAHPSLKSAEGEQRMFVAGYLAHIAMDVVWAEVMLYPYFYQRDDWADDITRYNMLHVLLCHLDTRDFRQWDANFPDALTAAQPDNWLPFLPDDDLAQWRDLVANQICVSCESRTLEVLGKRVKIGVEGLRRILDDPAKMQSEIWNYVPMTAVDHVEAQMYGAMVSQIKQYLVD